jgi:phospholipid/cholesterol/gamma-HCH transport system permease protein
MKKGILYQIGKRTVEFFNGLQETCAFVGEICCRTFEVFFMPKRFRFGDMMLALERAGSNGVAINALVGFLLGVILAFQSATSLQMFGVEVYVADLMAIGLFRELGPIVTAILLAGRSGSAFAAEIGTMKVDEELDALETMDLPPVRFLVLPRIVAAMIAMPLLTIICELAGLIGGALVLKMMNIPLSVYWNHVADSSTVFMILLGLAKAVVFGLVIAIVGCGAGMRTRNTADGVGVAATKAVVGGILSVVILDGIIAVICYIFNV